MKLASETCRFPFREKHKGVKQRELADLSFKPCGKILPVAEAVSIGAGKGCLL